MIIRLIDITGLLLWEDEDDPKVVEEYPDGRGSITQFFPLREALADIWRENGHCNVKITIEVV